MAPRTALLPALALATGLALLGAPPASAGPDRRPNFVIFVVDMLRADHLGVYGYPKRTSPNLDRLAEGGIVFERAYSAAPWTLPSTVSLLTGLVASEHGAGERRVDAQTRRITFPADPDVWLPTRFAAQGYATAAFHSHPYLRRGVSTIHEAFEEYYDSVGDAPSTAGASHWTPHAAEHMFLDALYPLVERWIAGHRDRPFLIYIHAIDVHGPYARVRLLDEDRPRVARMRAAGEIPFRKMPGTELYASTDQRDAHKSYLYDGHIAAVDDHLGRLHAALAAHGLADDTYLVFASDHGEGFGEHGDYWGHGRYVYDEQIRVPLVFLSHRRLRDAPHRTASHVNTVGLLPTLADLAGIALEEPHASRGFAALVGAAPARAAWRYDSVSAASLEGRFDAITLDGRYKLITDRKSGAREFYDLAADPGERAPLALQSATPEVRRRLEELVARRGELEAERRPRTSQTRALDADAVRALEALGYLR